MLHCFTQLSLFLLVFGHRLARVRKLVTLLDAPIGHLKTLRHHEQQQLMQNYLSISIYSITQVNELKFLTTTILTADTHIFVAHHIVLFQMPTSSCKRTICINSSVHFGWLGRTPTLTLEAVRPRSAWKDSCKVGPHYRFNLRDALARCSPEKNLSKSSILRRLAQPCTSQSLANSLLRNVGNFTPWPSYMDSWNW